jgi:uncharacterized membrane protein
MAGAAHFQKMNMRASTPNESMREKRAGTRPTGAAQGSIEVKAPVSDVYQRWLAFEDYPKFISVFKRVHKLDANHFVASLHFHGKQYETTLEMMLRIQDRRLAWRTVSDGHFATGVVSFLSHGDGMTRITLKLTSSFGGAVGRRVDKYLRNFKRLIERPVRG